MLRRLASWLSLVLLGFIFLVGLTSDLQALSQLLNYQHRFMACIGIYGVKENLSQEAPQAICQRVLATRVDLDD